MKQFTKSDEEPVTSEYTFEENAVEIFLLHRFNVQQVSWQTVNGAYSALRLFYVHILDRKGAAPTT
ncbi:MAG: hypothetical protein ACJAYJ_004757 [Saprospiraceae bacterium]